MAAEAGPPPGSDVADVWSPDPVTLTPKPGTAPSKSWTPPESTSTQIDSKSNLLSLSQNATALNPIDTTVSDAPGIGDRGDYQFMEFPISADAGIETIKVNVASGNTFIRTRLMELSGPGVSASTYRVFNSMDRWTQTSGWATDFDRTGLWMDNGKVAFFDGTGARWDFTASGSSWIAPPGANATLTKNGDGSWTVKYNRTGVNRPGFGGVVRVWERGWTHAEGTEGW